MLSRGHMRDAANTDSFILVEPHELGRKWLGFTSGALQFLFIHCNSSERAVWSDSANQPAIFENHVTSDGDVSLVSVGTPTGGSR